MLNAFSEGLLNSCAVCKRESRCLYIKCTAYCKTCAPEGPLVIRDIASGVTQWDYPKPLTVSKHPHDHVVIIDRKTPDALREAHKFYKQLDQKSSIGPEVIAGFINN